LRGASLRDLTLRRADLSGAYLAGAVLSEAEDGGADFGRADLSGATLVGAHLAGADLTEASLLCSFAFHTRLAGARLRGTDAAGVNFQRADLRGADLTGADLSRANLFRADLTGADLTGADLTGADLNGAVLEAARLDRAVLRDIRLFMTSIPEGFGEARVEIATWSSWGSNLYKALQTAATVAGAQFDPEFARWSLPALERTLAEADVRWRAEAEPRYGPLWAAYGLLTRPRTGTETLHRSPSGAWVSVDERGRACPLGGVLTPTGGFGALLHEAYPRRARSYRMTLPAPDFPAEVRDALTRLVARYGRRPGAPATSVEVRETGGDSGPAVTVTVDAPSLDYVRGRLRSVRRAILLPDAYRGPGMAAA
jgi:uncharacterized protein YjbI with pentapeptide repeats